MTSGLERLHHELVQIDEALRAFDAPIVELLAALQRGVRELAVELSRDWSPAPDDSVVRDEATLWLVSSGGAPAELTLQFPRRPEEQLVDPTTQSSLLVDVLEAVAAAVEGARPALALQAPAAVVVGGPV